jgi:hypothetical protein
MLQSFHFLSAGCHLLQTSNKHGTPRVRHSLSFKTRVAYFDVACEGAVRKCLDFMLILVLFWVHCVVEENVSPMLWARITNCVCILSSFAPTNFNPEDGHSKNVQNFNSTTH